MSHPRHALFVNEGTYDLETGTYTVGLAAERVPGYTVHNAGWKRLEDAKDYVQERNAQLGHSPEEAVLIVASSMAAGNQL